MLNEEKLTQLKLRIKNFFLGLVGLEPDYSIYSTLTKAQKLELTAKIQAMEFLTELSAYSEGKYEIDVPGPGGVITKTIIEQEKLPVLSDTNTDALKDLLIRFYNRNVQL